MWTPDAIGGLVTSVATVVDDLWVSDEEKMLASAAQTQAQAQLTSAQGQADASASAAALAATESKAKWETIQYALLGVGILSVLALAYKASQG